MQHIKAQSDRLQTIPPKKFGQKLQKTATGVGSIGLGLAIAKWFPDLSEWAVYGLIGFGGYCLAGDLVRGYLGYVPAAIRDLAEAIGELRNVIGKRNGGDG